MNILEQLKDTDNFSDAEQHIIHYLLQSPENIIDLSIKDIAKASNTSASTVTRLVNKLNNQKGFSHFKASFFNEINNIEMTGTNASDISENDTAFSIINKIAALETESIERTRVSLDRSALIKAFQLLNESEQIEFYGFDDNLHMVKYHLFRLMMCGKQVVVHDSTNAQIFQAYTSASTHTAIMVSRTGENKRLLEIADVLKIRKTPIILLTPDINCPLGSYASRWIKVEDTPLAQIIGNITFDISLQYILNVILGLFYSKTNEYHEDLINSYKKLWDNNL